MQLAATSLRHLTLPAHVATVALRSPILKGWAKAGCTLSLDTGSELARAAAFADFLRTSCSVLASMYASSTHAGAQDVARFKAPSLTQLTCEDFMPTGSLPQSLTRLSVCSHRELPPLAHEALFAELGALPALQQLSLRLSGSHILLRARALPGLALTSLQRLSLSILHLSDETLLDISALGGSKRAFELHLDVAPGEQDSYFYWQEPLQHLCSVLQPQDSLQLHPGRGGLSGSEQALLAPLRLTSFTLCAEPAGLLRTLPQAARITLQVLYPGLPPGWRHTEISLLDWSLLSRAPCNVRVNTPVSHLLVTGYSGEHCQPRLLPWGLELSGFGTIEGLSGVEPQMTTGGPLYRFMNRAASAAGWAWED